MYIVMTIDFGRQMEAFVVQMEKEMIKERAMLFEVKMLFMR